MYIYLFSYDFPKKIQIYIKFLYTCVYKYKKKAVNFKITLSKDKILINKRPKGNHIIFVKRYTNFSRRLGCGGSEEGCPQLVTTFPNVAARRCILSVQLLIVQNLMAMTCEHYSLWLFASSSKNVTLFFQTLIFRASFNSVAESTHYKIFPALSF